MSSVYKDNGEKTTKHSYCSSRKSVQYALIEFSTTNIGKIKTRQNINDELISKYGFSLQAIVISPFEINDPSPFPKLFKRISDNAYECLGYKEFDMPNKNPLFCRKRISRFEEERIKNIIIANFQGGFRLKASIDFERFKNYYFNTYKEEFKKNNLWLDALLKEEGVLVENKAFIFNDKTVETVHKYLIETNSLCISSKIFFEAYSKELYSMGLFTIEILKAFINKKFKKISFKYNYISLADNVNPEVLIRKLFNEKAIWSVDEIAVKLPWLNKQTIKSSINNEMYFSTGSAKYTHLDNIDLPDSEGEKICSFINYKLKEKDYVGANELDLSLFNNLNSHLPFTTIRDAVFIKFLKNKFNKSGQIITSLDKKLRVQDVLMQYCSNMEKISFDELKLLEESLDSKGRGHLECLIAAHKVMIRVSFGLFIKRDMLVFDVDRIDEILEFYCIDDFIPLQAIKDFSLFPVLSYPWNLFLLESYLRNFSKIFSYDVRAVNSAHIGVIVRKSFDYNDYSEILANVVAKSQFSLNNKVEIGEYLFNKGYIGWRNLNKDEKDIFGQAKLIRERERN